jgi:hypothetical protein
MKGLCEFYIRHPRLIGACYCILPLIATYAILFTTNPFRAVYVLRLVLSLVLGIPIAAYVNEFGLRLWLIKHRSAEGPATVYDGFLIGAGIGLAAVFVPPLLSLIATHHLEEVKLLIIAGWGAGVLVGGMIGALLAAIGRKYVSRMSIPNED